MIHQADADFWSDYSALPAILQSRADKQFVLLKSNPHHRVTLKYRVLAVKFPGEYL